MSSKLWGFVCVASIVCAAAMVLTLFSVPVPANDVKPKTERTALTDSARTALQTRVFAIVKRSCAVSGCHTGKRPEAKMVLDPQAMLNSTKNVPSREIPALKRIDTQNPEKSYLLMKIRGATGIRGARMPRGGPSLKEEEINAIGLWIQDLSILENAKGKAGGQ